MTKAIRGSFIDALDCTAGLLSSIEGDFRANRLHHSAEMEKTRRCLQRVLIPTGNALDIDLMINHKIHGLEDSLADIAAAVREKVDSRIRFSDEAVAEITALFAECRTFLKASLAFLRTDRSVFLRELEARQTEYKKHCDDCASTHDKRLAEGTCVPAASALYLDLVHGFKGTCAQTSNIIRLVAGLPDPDHAPGRPSLWKAAVRSHSWADL